MFLFKLFFKVFIIMKKKNVRDCDYLCSCGQLLINTCNFAIRKHRKTTKHINILNGKRKMDKPNVPNLKKEEKIITIIFE